MPIPETSDMASSQGPLRLPSTHACASVGIFLGCKAYIISWGPMAAARRAEALSNTWGLGGVICDMQAGNSELL